MEYISKRIHKVIAILWWISFLTEASVLIIPAGDALPKAHQSLGVASESLEGFLHNSAPRAFNPNNNRIKPVEGTQSFDRYLRPSGDSFVRGAIESWGLHQHFIVRPEEVWFTILVQMSFYMSATQNSEALRDVFVSHQGKQEISIPAPDLDVVKALSKFRFAIQERVKTPWLMDWIVPNHTTTSTEDVMISNVLMMGLMKAYFKFKIPMPVCGLPSVTLLGEKSDYQNIREKLKMLNKFGQEPTQYQRQLMPILDRFVRSFDDPTASDIREFWANIVHTNVIPGRKEGCSSSPPIYEISGWIAGFHFWNEEGKVLGNRGLGKYRLDNVEYPIRSQDSLPVGYSKANVLLITPGSSTNAAAAAGTIGKKIWPGMPTGYIEAVKRLKNSTLLATIQESPSTIHSQLQPTSRWWMFTQDGSQPAMRENEGNGMGIGTFASCPNNWHQLILGQTPRASDHEFE